MIGLIFASSVSFAAGFLLCAIFAVDSYQKGYEDGYEKGIKKATNRAKRKDSENNVYYSSKA